MFDKDNLEGDSLQDLQASYSTYIASMIYTQEL